MGCEILMTGEFFFCGCGAADFIAARLQSAGARSESAATARSVQPGLVVGLSLPHMSRMRSMAELEGLRINEREVPESLIAI
jgi:hypothetical protein